jgi:hypothetical protein
MDVSPALIPVESRLQEIVPDLVKVWFYIVVGSPPYSVTNLDGELGTKEKQRVHARGVRRMGIAPYVDTPERVVIEASGPSTHSSALLLVQSRSQSRMSRSDRSVRHPDSTVNHLLPAQYVVGVAWNHPQGSAYICKAVEAVRARPCVNMSTFHSAL